MIMSCRCGNLLGLRAAHGFIERFVGGGAAEGGRGCLGQAAEGSSGARRVFTFIRAPETFEIVEVSFVSIT